MFSNRRGYRLERHFLFWFAVFLYHSVLISFFYPNHLLENISPILYAALTWGTFNNIIFSYTVVYYLVPRIFIKKKYILFVASILLLFIIMFLLGILRNMTDQHLMVSIGANTANTFFKATTIRTLGNPRPPVRHVRSCRGLPSHRPGR